MERDITDSDRDKIINFGAFGYPVEKMANILMWDVVEVEKLMKNKKSEFARLYKKGEETADYVIDLKLFEMAQSGDLKALQKFEFRRKQKKNE